MFDFASNVSEGVRNTTTLFDRDALDRVRRPRFIAKDGVVRPYNQAEGIPFEIQS
jgi:vacuolar protein sorting-associated protein 13A/C